MKGMPIFGAMFLLLLGASSAATQDALNQTPAQGIRIGPYPHAETVQGIALTLRVSTFLVPEDEDGRLRISSRVVTDLSDFQKKIDAIVRTIPLPTDNCRQRGIDDLNPVARTWGEELSVDDEMAILKLDGEVEGWTCWSVFGNIIKNRLFSQSFVARFPFRLRVSGRSLALDLGNPDVDLQGGISELTEEILALLGVDIRRHVREAVERAIKPDVLDASLPAEVRRLDPTITRARFFDNAGSLAASLEMTATLDADDLLGLFDLLKPAPEGSP